MPLARYTSSRPPRPGMNVNAKKAHWKATSRLATMWGTRFMPPNGRQATDGRPTYAVPGSRLKLVVEGLLLLKKQKRVVRKAFFFLDSAK